MYKRQPLDLPRQGLDIASDLTQAASPQKADLVSVKLSIALSFDDLRISDDNGLFNWLSFQSKHRHGGLLNYCMIILSPSPFLLLSPGRPFFPTLIQTSNTNNLLIFRSLIMRNSIRKSIPFPRSVAMIIQINSCWTRPFIIISLVRTSFGVTCL